MAAAAQIKQATTHQPHHKKRLFLQIHIRGNMPAAGGKKKDAVSSRREEKGGPIITSLEEKGEQYQ